MVFRSSFIWCVAILVSCAESSLENNKSPFPEPIFASLYTDPSNNLFEYVFQFDRLKGPDQLDSIVEALKLRGYEPIASLYGDHSSVFIAFAKDDNKEDFFERKNSDEFPRMEVASGASVFQGSGGKDAPDGIYGLVEKNPGSLVTINFDKYSKKIARCLSSTIIERARGYGIPIILATARPNRMLIVINDVRAEKYNFHFDQIDGRKCGVHNLSNIIFNYSKKEAIRQLEISGVQR